MESILIDGVAGGKHVVDGPLTTGMSNEGSPSLLRNSIDERIAKIRPMSTPIDQLSRCGGARSCDSMVVNYYSVDTKATEAKVASDVSTDGYESVYGTGVFYMQTDNDGIFEPSETLYLPATETREAVMLYVLSKSAENGLLVKMLTDEEVEPSCISVDDVIVRMGRAASELDVQTAQFEALPTKAENLCQIFKMQVEQSTFQKIANKEVGWTFSDQEEVAVIDMRLGMEKNFLFGKKFRYTDPIKHDEVMMTGGIWWQAGQEMTIEKEFTKGQLVSMCRKAFTGNTGSKRKILIGGSGFIEKLSTMESEKVIQAGETMVKWGVEFHEIRSNFGTLYVVHSEVFDQCGHENDAMIIDPEYMTKYVHVPFRTEKLDLRSSGLRNTDAIVITEASCLVLRYPQSHMRVLIK
jgi:hypothetical protein